MVNCSFTIFGPNDGFQQFTLPAEDLQPKEHFQITPQDFNFKSGGKLIQIIKSESDSIYISFHQQVFQVNGERPGYTFGEALYFENSSFDINLVVKDIYQMHSAFAHNCLNENKRFDGAKFVGMHRDMQHEIFQIFKSELQTRNVDNKKLINSERSRGNAYYICEDISNRFNVTSIINWMIDSIGSCNIGRLFIIDKNSGIPSDTYRTIENIENESNSIFKKLINETNSILDKNKRLEENNKIFFNENNNLNSQVQNLKNDIRMFQSQVTSVKNIADKPHPASNEVLQSLDVKIDRISADVNKLKSFSFNKIAEDFECVINQINFLKTLISVVLIICLICFCIAVYLGLNVYSMNKKMHVLQNTLDNTIIDNNNKILNKLQEMKINSDIRSDTSSQAITSKPAINPRNEKNYK
jgi:hypothetical protein